MRIRVKFPILSNAIETKVILCNISIAGSVIHLTASIFPRRQQQQALL